MIQIKRITYFKRFLFTVLIFLKIYAFGQETDQIKPGEIWPDNRGMHIQAHGGGITKVKDVYYWYGEERARGLDSNKRYVSCYSSKDLVHWKFRGDVVQMTDPDNLGTKWLLERPKVYYNKANGMYVMYFHLDNASYQAAKIGIAISNRPDGRFKYLKSFRPLGHESRDIGQFVDDDGTSYLIFEDRPYGFRIARLSADLLSVEKQICLIPFHMEGGAIVHYKGRYYVIGSSLTGWQPNPNKYATAKSLEGPWSDFKDIAPPETNTYGSQSTLMLKVIGDKKTTVLFLGDIWKPKALWDSRYLWQPVAIGNGELSLPNPQPFEINIKTGETKN